MTENTATKTVGWNRRAITLPVIIVEGEEFLRLSNGSLRSTCWKCDGRGGFDVYAGLHGGVCYRCNGSGVEVKSYDDEAQAAKAIVARRRRQERVAAKREAEAAEAREAAEAWAAANPVLAARLAAVHAEVYVEDKGESAMFAARAAGDAKYGDFILTIANKASYKALTEAQMADVATALDEVEAAAAVEAAKVSQQRYLDVAIGTKVTVTGTVAVATTIETHYGSSRVVVVEGTEDFTGVTFKMLGTGATLWETSRGDVVEITAAVKDFDEYNGTRQTVLTRSKIKALATA